MNKENYLKPEAFMLEFEITTMLMSASDGIVDTGMGNTPSRPDAREHRGEWGDLWQ